MKPYDKLTIVRNRHRVNDLIRFRRLIEAYFERSEYVDDMPVDWDGARVARAQVNQMLPRIIDIVEAARLTDTRLDAGILRNIFTDVQHTEEEIFDLVDMALGVYQASRFNAVWRTVNPLHYVGVVLSFALGLPRHAIIALGFPIDGAGKRRLTAESATRLEAVASRVAESQAVIERTISEMRDLQERQFAEGANQLADLGERLDFAERVLTQRPPAQRLGAPHNGELETPV